MSEEKMSTIGARIRQVRGDMKLVEFAEFIGVGKSTVSRYENDQGNPDAEFMTALYVKCGVQPLWLLTGQGARGEQLTPREAALLDNYRHIDDEEGKRYVERSAQMAARPPHKEEAEPGAKKKA